MEVTGIDHVYLTVSDFERSERFYDLVMQLLGFRKGDKLIAGGARHPRNDRDWPAVGIFAQRGKNRPNRIAARSAESSDGKVRFSASASSTPSTERP